MYSMNTIEMEKRKSGNLRHTKIRQQLVKAMFSLLQNYLPISFPFIILLSFIICIWITFRFKINKNLPPSPPKLPIIGNLHQLGSSPHRSLRTLSQKHGPLMLMHFGSVPMLVASSSEAAKEIMKTHDLKFANRPKLRTPDTLIYGSSDITFSPYGEFWRQVKSIAVVHLLNNARVQSFRQVREEEIGYMIDTIAKSHGSLVDLSELTFWFVNNIVCKVALGRSYQGLKFTDLLGKFVHVLGALCVGNFIPWLSWIDRLSGLDDKARNVAKEFDEFLEGVVNEHLEKRSKGDDHNGTNQDLVDILLDIQRENAIGFALQRDTIKAIILPHSPPFLLIHIYISIFRKWKICFTSMIRFVKIDLNVPPRPPGYAFVKFEEAHDAEDAIRGRDGYDFDGHRLRVELSHGGHGNSSSTSRHSSHGSGRGGHGGVSRRSDYRGSHASCRGCLFFPSFQGRWW
ncbi:hypothetical protein QVD17_16372 [Tagetes erecta]|uniref:RRM domain-containing protein n=1 Tax=Tagetes erecta TaxID=13708 RepID=A0AAD8NTH5_TARER|nr:hypothetical protein QVD17_16372 [Tagetes erecta]